jgi:hypothetical protein
VKELQWFQKLMCIALSCLIFIAGCGGIAANPADKYFPGDEKKSCTALFAEMQNLDENVVVHNQQRVDRDHWNGLLFVGGFFLIVPWFFMDIKGSQEVEIEAFRARKDALKIIYAEKDCSAPSGN